MKMPERDAVRKIYALPEPCKLGDLVKAFEMNPCKRARIFILMALQAAMSPYKIPQDPEVREFYNRIRSTPCKY